MSADQRLDRLLPALSAKERASLILRAWKAGEDHEPQIRSTIPNNQVFEYNRLVALMRGASGDLTNFIVVVVQLVEQLSLRWCWLTSVHVAALNAEDVASTALAAVNGKERTALRRALRPRMARFAVSLFDDPRWAGAEDDGVAQEFDGEDPLDPEVRILLDKCRADLLDLKEHIEPYTGTPKQEERDEELVNRLREIVRDG